MRDKVPSSDAGARVAQLNRYGAGFATGVAMVFSIMVTSDAFAAEISVQELQQNAFEFTLTNDERLDERQAQAYIAQAARAICKGLSPVLGKYRFESSEALGTGAVPRDAPSFRFVQQVTCMPGSRAEASTPAPTPTSPEEQAQVREQITRATETHFRSLAAARFDEVYAQLGEEANGTEMARWVQEVNAFRQLAGDPVSIAVVAVSIYDNPPDAPEPGLYVAADFQNAYKNVPYECGYLVWHRPVGGTSFSITRIDRGHVTTEQLERIPEIQRPELLRKLRCAAP